MATLLPSPTTMKHVYICSVFICMALGASNRGCRVSYESHLHGSRVECQHLQLKDVPSGLPNDTKYLDLRNNRLNVLKNKSFETLSELLYLYLDSNQIWHLESGAFDGLSQLSVLSLNDNNLNLDNETYPKEIFFPLLCLQELYIGQNDGSTIGVIPDMIFLPLVNLEKLQIDTFRTDVFGRGFANLRKLINLDIATGIEGGRRYCGLEYVQNKTFTVFGNTKLQRLDLSGCEIHYVESGVFLPLRYISEIRMHDVLNLPTGIVVKAFFGINNRNISKILLHKSFHPVPQGHDVTHQLILKETVSFLSNLCIEYLDLSSNKIVYIDDTFMPLFSECIKHIDLSENNLLGSVSSLLILYQYRKLQYFDMSNQQNFQNHWHHAPAIDKFIKLPTVRIDDTNMNQLSKNECIFYNSQLDGVGFMAPPNIRVVKFRSVTGHFGKFYITKITNALHITTLDLSYNEAWGFVNPLSGLRSLQILDLSGNEGYGMAKEFLGSFPNIHHLYMNDMGFDEEALIDGGNILEGIKTMRNISHLELAGNAIKFISHNLSHTLTTLNLARNNFISLPINLFHVPNLKYIDLTFNSITFLDDDEIEMLEVLGNSNKLLLKLKGNPISCSCHCLSFISWIFTSEVDFDESGNYSCVTDNGALSTTRIVFKQLNYHWTYCQGKIWLPISVALLCLLIGVVLSGFIVTKNWTRIQHRLLVILGRGVQIVKRQEFKNDAYVAHSEEDRRFVLQILMKSLENFNLRLILPERDFLPGRYVADNVVESVNNSWKTVLIVTDSFLDDSWSYFIMRTVSYSVSYSNSNRVIILMIGYVNRGRLPESILNVTEEEDIIQTDEFPGPDSEIWAEIRKRIVSEAT